MALDRAPRTIAAVARRARYHLVDVAGIDAGANQVPKD